MALLLQSQISTKSQIKDEFNPNKENTNQHTDFISNCNLILDTPIKNIQNQSKSYFNKRNYNKDNINIKKYKVLK